MFILSKISLKVLLIGGFLLCALLTGFSGGVGIFSLSQIKSVMTLTTNDVTQNVDIQNTQTQQLIPIRKLITQIFETNTTEELNKISSDLSEFEKNSTFTTKDIQQIYKATEELADTKQNQISAVKDLTRLMDKNVITLETITKLTIECVNTSVNESIETIENETKSIKAGFGIRKMGDELGMAIVFVPCLMHQYLADGTGCHGIELPFFDHLHGPEDVFHHCLAAFNGGASGLDFTFQV